MQKWQRLLSNLLVVLLLLVHTITLPLNVSAQETSEEVASSEMMETSSSSETLPSSASEESTSAESILEEASSEEALEQSSQQSEEPAVSEEKEVLYRSVNGPAKELANIFSEVTIWDLSNGREATLKDGVYHLVANVSYAFQMTFDLSEYDANLNNGDYFTANIPAPVNVRNASFDLIDEDTGLDVGTATVTSNGENAGGTVHIILKNLEKYLDIKQSTEVIGVKGTFYVNFKSLVQDTEKVLTFDNIKTTGTKDIIIKVTENILPDNTEAVGRENIAKYSGVLAKRPYDSAILGRKGDYVHPWRVRLNAKKKQYDSFVVTDRITETSRDMQFIPETFVLATGSGVNQGWQLNDHVVLQQGVDYTVTFDANYKTFTLTILRPLAQPYFLDYQTTAPADGLKVGNIVSVETNEGALPSSDINSRTEILVERLSKVTEGGTIQLDTGYRIVLYKIDEATQEKLAGAVFKVTRPNGTEFTLPPTDAEGRTYSEVITAEEARSGEFTVTEVTAPTGYELDITPIKLTVTREGAIRTITNRKPVVEFTVTKKWLNGDAANRPSVQFQLKRDGVNYGEVKTLAANSADGATIKWSNLPKYQDGTQTLSVYTVEELPVADYTAQVSDVTPTSATITNTYTNTETITLSGKKTWNDQENQDGKRPQQIIVKVMNGDQKVAEKTVTQADNWQYTFSNLPKYDMNGKLIQYQIDEEVVAGYRKEVNGTDITNHYTPETTSLMVVKRWDDKDDADKIRPQSVKVQLYVAGKAQGDAIELNAANNWQHTFMNLPKFIAGEMAKYEVKEIEVPKGYTATYQADQPMQITITNTHTPTPPTPPSTPPTTPKKEEPKLPKTGEDFPWMTSIVGGLILLGAIGYFIYTKKHNQ